VNKAKLKLHYVIVGAGDLNIPLWRGKWRRFSTFALKAVMGIHI
jgi:hypothetical protein